MGIIDSIMGATTGAGSGNQLQDRLNYLKGKFNAASGVGMSGATTPVPVVQRIAILATPYAIGKGGKTITGDVMPSGMNFAMGNSSGFFGAILSRLGPLGQRSIPVYQETPASTPASSSVSGNTHFYGAVSEPSKSQKLNNYLSG